MILLDGSLLLQVAIMHIDVEWNAVWSEANRQNVGELTRVIENPPKATICLHCQKRPNEEQFRHHILHKTASQGDT